MAGLASSGTAGASTRCVRTPAASTPTDIPKAAITGMMTVSQVHLRRAASQVRNRTPAPARTCSNPSSKGRDNKLLRRRK